MTRRLVVRPTARFELAAGSDWYDLQKQGLGAEFIHAFEAAAAAITENPFQYQIVYRGARRAPFGRFPYGLIYTVRMMRWSSSRAFTATAIRAAGKTE